MVKLAVRTGLRAGLAVACVFTAAACASAAGPPDATTSPQVGFAAYLGCLRSHGVDLPQNLPSGGPDGSAGPRRSPGPSPRPSARPSAPFGFDQPPAGVDPATWNSARAACDSARPTAGPAGNDSAYRNCLSDHGVTPGPQLNSADPTVAAAMAICRVLRPSARPGPSG